MAMMSRRGREWVRIASIALLVIFAVNLGWSIIASERTRASLSHSSGVPLLLDVLAALIGLAATILLLSPQSSAYLRECGSERGIAS